MYEPAPEILEISRALGDSTRFAIYCHITSSTGPITVKELVDAFGLHHSAIRIHLHKLQESGLIACSKLERGGMVGRPQLAFIAGAKPLNITLPPRNYEFLAGLVLDLATADGATPEALDSFAEAWGRRYIREHARTDMPLAEADALEYLCRQLDNIGASMRYESMNGDGFALVETNCLFSGLATARDPSVCLLHQAAIRGMLSELCGARFEFQHSSSLAQGAGACYTRVARLGT